MDKCYLIIKIGVLEEIRTLDLSLRRRLLYPAELPGQNILSDIIILQFNYIFNKKEKTSLARCYCYKMASLKRFELPTHGLEGRCSILLSYRLTTSEPSLSESLMVAKRGDGLSQRVRLAPLNRVSYPTGLQKACQNACRCTVNDGYGAGDGNRTHAISLEG